MRIYVIAGNREQASEWIKNNLTKRHHAGETDISWSDYVIVRDIVDLRGCQDPHGVFVGTWKERSNIKEIVLQLCITSMHRNQSLIKIRRELQKPKIKGINISGVIVDELDIAINRASKAMADNIDKLAIEYINE